MDLNKVMLIGRLTKDPELKTTPSGVNVVKFSLATSYKYKETDTTEFHNIVAFGKLADIISQYCRKGQQVYVEGRLQTSSWEKDGVKKYRTEIIANNLIMLGSKGESNSVSNQAPTNAVQPTGDEEEIDLESIPF